MKYLLVIVFFFIIGCDRPRVEVEIYQGGKLVDTECRGGRISYAWEGSYYKYTNRKCGSSE